MTELALTSLANSGLAPNVMVQKVTSTPKRRSRCARSTVQMLVVGQSLRMTRRSQRRAPRPPSIINTHARPQSLPTVVRRSARRLAQGHGRCARCTHQLNDCRTCGTSTVCERRSCSVGSSSAAGACARALRARRTSAQQRQAPSQGAHAPRSRGTAARHSAQLGGSLQAAAGGGGRGAGRSAPNAARQAVAPRHRAGSARVAQTPCHVACCRRTLTARACDGCGASGAVLASARAGVGGVPTRPA